MVQWNHSDQSRALRHGAVTNATSGSARKVPVVTCAHDWTELLIEVA
jgi:hypothetical protein